MDGRAQRLGVGLLEARAVAQLDGPVLGALVQHRVEVVDRLDALAQQLERLLGLPRALDGVLELRELGGDGVDLALEVDLALRDRRDLDLAGAEALGDGALLAEARVARLSRARRGLLERSSSASRLLDAPRVLVERRAVLRGALGELGEALLDERRLSVSSAVSCCSSRPTSSSSESCSPVSAATFCESSSASCCASESASSAVARCGLGLAHLRASAPRSRR